MGVALGFRRQPAEEARPLDQRSNPTSRPQGAPAERIDFGLQSLALIAGYYHIAAEPVQLAHDLGLAQRAANSGDLVRAAQRLGLKARILKTRRPSGSAASRCPPSCP